jgi:hypothetical protein
MNNNRYTLLGAILFIFVIGLIWFWGGNQDLKTDNKYLTKEYKALQKRKESVDKALVVLKKDNLKLKQQDSSIQKIIKTVKIENTKITGELKRSKKELKKYRETVPMTLGDSLCDDVILSYDSLVTVQKIEIGLKDSLISNKDSQISNLDKQVANEQLKHVMLNGQLSIQADIISNKNLQIKRLKTRTIIVGTAASAVVIGTILSLILIK